MKDLRTALLEEFVASTMAELRGLPAWRARDAVFASLLADGLEPGQASQVADAAFPAGAGLQPFRLVEVFLTRACNLACPYCFVHEKAAGTTMTVETARQAAQWIAAHTSSTAPVNVVFLGGEPLLAFRRLRTIVEALREAWTGRANRLRFDLTTNGTLLDEETAGFLARAGVYTLISIDGARDRHDRTRVFPDGRGSFDLVAAALARVRRLQGFAGVRMTVQGWAVPWLLEDVRGLAALGAQSFILGRATGVAWTEDELRSFYRELGRVREWIAARPGLRLVEPGAREMLRGGLAYSWGCRAGNTGIAIDWDGSLFPCSKVIGVDPKSTGGARCGSIYDVLRDTPLLQSLRGDRIVARPQCRSCEIRDSCAGGCFATNLESTGDLFTPGEDHCRAMRAYLQASRV